MEFELEYNQRQLDGRKLTNLPVLRVGVEPRIQLDQSISMKDMNNDVRTDDDVSEVPLSDILEMSSNSSVCIS
jgi:hypothetical protein